MPISDTAVGRLSGISVFPHAMLASLFFCASKGVGYHEYKALSRLHISCMDKSAVGHDGMVRMGGRLYSHIAEGVTCDQTSFSGGALL